MSKELVIGSNRHETKVAILEDDQLVEIFFQRANEYSLAGSIHKGRVTRVLPGMQSAFVDLGLERDTFLYVSDFFEENPDIDTVDEKPSRDTRRDDNRRDRAPARLAERGSPVQTVPPPVAFDEPEEETQQEIDDPALFPDDPINGAVVSEVPPTAGAAASLPAPGGDETRQSQRPPEGDRNFRGDRRGRRSRRRRTRGGGFPDNKYAQPGDVTAPPRAHSPSFQQDATAEPEIFETEEREIIILPGESLAKYRGPAVSQTARVLEPEPLSEPEPERAQEAPRDAQQYEAPDSIASSPSPGEKAEIAAEAHSLELADRVFAHRPEDAVAAEHQPAPVHEASVAYSERPSAFLVSSEEAREIAESDLESSHTASRQTEPVEEPAAPTETAFDDAGVEEPAEGAFGDEDPPERTAQLPFADDEELDEEELKEGPEFDEPSSLENPVETAPPQAAAPAAEAASQTAVVRDPGDRYPHRVSRRMRRRRGGNRFAGQANTPQTAGSESPAETHSISAGAASGAAAALDAEPRVALPVRSAESPTKEPRFEGRSQDRSGEKADREERPMPSISELLRPGQEIIVQIAKEPLGQKGARITSHIALPGRYVVFMPSVAHLGVSRKIASDEERQRLKRILQTHRVGTTGGFIVRTAGEGVPEDGIAADMDFLYKSWLDIRQKAEKKPAPMLLHYDLDIVQRILRDQVTEEFKSIWVDSEDMYEGILSFLQRFQPALVNRVKMYTRQAPIFDAFGITQELEKALRPKVWLKSGGYIVINQTEALVAIDINTGKYVGKSNRLEDTIVKTNTEAVKEIVRQIRLRDLGGIIVVDFIDMDERKNRQKVMQALEEAMQGDRAPSKILQFNDFGLVAITRKRVKQSLERTLCSPCPYCEGAGYVKSVQTVIGEILIEAQKIARAIEGKDVLLRVHPEVAKLLKANDNKFLEELEEILGRPVLVKSDPALHLEKFDLG